jgi:hypothetical protein
MGGVGFAAALRRSISISIDRFFSGNAVNTLN